MKRLLYVFFLISFFIVKISKAQVPVILDDFSDGNWNLNPTWSLNAGGNAPTISAGVLVTASSNMRLLTALTTPCQEWGFKVKTSSTSNTADFRYYFILRDNSDPTNTASKSYFLSYSGNTGDFEVFRQENTTPVSIGSYNGPTTLNFLQVKITMTTSGNIKLFIDGVEVISVDDATYCPFTSQWQLIRIFGSTAVGANNLPYNADDFYYVATTCSNPATGGKIGANQIQCQSFDPTPLTEVTAASSCYYDNNGQPLQYQWQSTINLASGFSDIVGAISSSYDPPSTSANTYYRRLTKVSCATNGVESDTIQVFSKFQITSVPLDITIYEQTGADAVFSVEVSALTGNVFQWQVNMNGTDWINITSGVGGYTVSSPAGIGYRSFLQVDNPVISMNGYKYRCVVTNSSVCIPSNSATSIAATLLVKNQLSAANTTSYACDGWDGQIEIPITVSGVGTLNTSTNLLRQINLTLGSSSCKKDLSNYDFFLIAPTGTNRSLQFVDNFTSVSTPVWADIKFRDHPSLERVKDYSSTTTVAGSLTYLPVQTRFFPYSVGYYAVETDGSLASAFDGILADGVWTLRITETPSGGVLDGISISKAELIFGSDIVERDVTGNSLNNSCALATCMGADQNVIIGTNNGYPENDPNYPGGGSTTEPTYNWGSCKNSFGTEQNDNKCAWNAANNNSSWFYFIATSSTASFTVSGLQTSTNYDNDQQLIVVDGRNGCVTTGNWTVPIGGCLNDISTCPSNSKLPNNLSYLTNNGGGVSAGDIYVNGISANTEFLLSGLVPGTRYFLVVDGRSGTSSSFYIEMNSGCAFCSILNSILPVKFDSFNAYRKGTKNQLIWKTSEELNNDYFRVERSSDGINWTTIKDVEGAGRNSKSMRTYEVMDETPLSGMNYYRIKTVTSDERFSYSEIRSILQPTNLPITVYPNPGKDIFSISGMEKGSMHQIRVLDINGKLIQSAVTGNDIYRLQMNEAAPGMYLIQIDGKENLRIVKQK